MIGDLVSGVLHFSGETSKEFDPNTVTPGVIGFIITFLVAAVTVLLILDMTRRVRRLRYRGEIAEKLDAEERDANRPTTDRPDTSRLDPDRPTTDRLDPDERDT